MNAYDNASDWLIRTYGDFGMPITEIDPAVIPLRGMPIIDLMLLTGLAPNRSAAGRFIESGRVSVDGKKVTRSYTAIPPSLLRCGVSLCFGSRVFRRAVMMKR